MFNTPTSPVELRVVINNRAATEYHKDGMTFIEGRKGSNFTLRVTNRLSAQRVHVVISVDGLNITTGKPAAMTDSGYVIGASSSIDIPGWLLDGNTAASFAFSSKKESYAQQGGGNTTNCGVIGVAVWSEKKPEIIHKGILRGISKGFQHDVWDASYNNSPYDRRIGSMDSNSDAVYAQAASASVNNLGTEFGERTDFSTKSVDFKNDSIIETLVLYYDDAKGLKARGIEVKKPAMTTAPTPNPFPGGCTPPVNWKG